MGIRKFLLKPVDKEELAALLDNRWDDYLAKEEAESKKVEEKEAKPKRRLVRRKSDDGDTVPPSTAEPAPGV